MNVSSSPDQPFKPYPSVQPELSQAKKARPISRSPPFTQQRQRKELCGPETTVNRSRLTRRPSPYWYGESEGLRPKATQYLPADCPYKFCFALLWRSNRCTALSRVLFPAHYDSMLSAAHNSCGFVGSPCFMTSMGNLARHRWSAVCGRLYLEGRVRLFVDFVEDHSQGPNHCNVKGGGLCQKAAIKSLGQDCWRK